MSRPASMLRSARSHARRHWPSGVVMVLVACAVVLLKVLAHGKVRPRIYPSDMWNGTYFFSTSNTYAHGWPAAFLYRDAEPQPILATNSLTYHTASQWDLGDSVIEFHPWRLVLNGLVGMVCVVLSTLVFHRWWRKGASRWRFGLRGLFAMVTLGALFVGWLATQRMHSQRTQQVLSTIAVK